MGADADLPTRISECRAFVLGDGPARPSNARVAVGRGGARARLLAAQHFRVVGEPDGNFVLGVATGARLALRRLRSDGSVGDWVDVGSDGNNAAQLRLAVDGTGTIHVLFSQFDEDAPLASIFYARCRWPRARARSV